MREILFRGKRTDNGEWVFGSLISHDGKRFIHPNEEYFMFDSDAGSRCLYYAVVFEVAPETVGRYTGLHDKTKWHELPDTEQRKFLSEGNRSSDWKGRRIFEGDIATIPYTKKQGLPAEVRYNVRDGMYEIRRNGYRALSLADADNWCMIVGNVFDNPELLAGSTE